MVSSPRSLHAILTVLTLGLGLSTPSAPAAESVTEGWPGWRGPTRDGHVSGPAWPERLQGNVLRKIWHKELGPSYSGPVVGRGKVFVTETVDKQREVVRALDARSGKEKWSTRWEGAMKVPFFAASNGSWIRSTPALHEGHLYVAGMRDRLVAIEADTGSVVWDVDFMKRHATSLPAFGFVCSPLVIGDAVYVQAGASFVKLDRTTGKTIWRTLTDKGGMYGSAFSSPILTQLHGASQLLVQTRTDLAGVAPDSGQVLWSQPVKAFRGMNILTPLVHENAVFTASYGGGSFQFRIEASDDKQSVANTWKSTTQGYMSTPVLIDGHIYMHLKNQRLACYEWTTGKKTWTTTERFGKYMSLVAQGSRILGLSEKGTLHLFAANPARFQPIDTRKISDSSTWAHLAVDGNRLYVRHLDGISAFAWEAPPTDNRAAAPKDGTSAKQGA